MNKQTAVEWLLNNLHEIGVNHNLSIKAEKGWLEKRNEIIEQAKQIEKEQMIEFAEFVASHPDKNRNYLGQMLHAKSKYDGAERTIDLLQLWKEQQPKTVYYEKKG